jgi:hypothetical protein
MGRKPNWIKELEPEELNRLEGLRDGLQSPIFSFDSHYTGIVSVDERHQPHCAGDYRWKVEFLCLTEEHARKLVAAAAELNRQAEDVRRVAASK